MQDKFSRFMYGRYGMDRLSKTMLIGGVVLTLLGSVLSSYVSFLTALFHILGMFSVVYGAFRVFSKNVTQRSIEYAAFSKFKDSIAAKRAAAKNRRSQSKDYRFFKCPGCGQWLRVPKGKGRIHINCRCGYTLYRKT